MDRKPAVTILKRGLVAFWALWLSIVFVTNLLDGLRALQVLSASWSFASGNYDFLVKVTGLLNPPAWLPAILFAGVVAWEGMAAGLFWRSCRRWHTAAGPEFGALYAAFAVSLALWAAFMIADEVFIAYQVENAHRGIFTAQLASLLVVRLLPDDGGTINNLLQK